jgi:hypothetical protein
VPIIRGLEPSRAAWGETVVVHGDFAPNESVRVAIRIGGTVIHLPVDESDRARVLTKLPDPPADVSDAVVADLFVVVARESSRACRLAIFNGPVLRRIVRAGEDEWVLHGTGFGGVAEQIEVMAPGAAAAHVISATNSDVRIRASLARRSSVRVAIGGRPSNLLQVLE